MNHAHWVTAISTAIVASPQLASPTANCAEWISAISTAIAAVAALAGVFVAWWQLRNLNDSLKMSVVSAALQLEAEMNTRKEKLASDANAIQKAKLDKVKSSEIELLNKHMQSSIENYLNVVDRMAFCIRKGYLPEHDWKNEYRDYFKDLVATHGTFFTASSPYINIIDMNKRWQRD